MSWKAVALALVSIAFTMAVLEAVFRLLPPTTLGYCFENDVFGRPQEFEPHLETNSLGFHDVEFGPKEPGVRRVLLLGDSFVQGLSVPIPQTLARRLHHHLEATSPDAYDVVSLAGPGYGPREELKLLKRYGTELAPDLVVSLFFPENDVIDASHALAKQHRRQLKALAKQPGPTTFRIAAADARFLLFRNSEFNRWISHRLTLAAMRRKRAEIPIDYFVWATDPPVIWHEAWRAVESFYAETQAFAGELGAGFAAVSATSAWSVRGDHGLEQLISIYPAMRGMAWDLERPEHHLARFCAGRGIPFLALLPAFRHETLEGGRRLHWRYDGHWNAEGNDLAARLIAEFIVGIDASAVTR